MNADLLRHFEADLQDHRQGLCVGTAEYTAMRERDAERRSAASRVLAEDPDLEAVDLYRAAWLFNHGDTPDDAERAYRLASVAASAGHAPARWLSAASYDRWQMYRGLPQRYGTQIVPDGVGFRVWDTDPSVTDEDRAALDVPPLADQHRRATEIGRTTPQPPLDLAPAWLLDALDRWAVEHP